MQVNSKRLLQASIYFETKKNKMVDKGNCEAICLNVNNSFINYPDINHSQGFVHIARLFFSCEIF